MLMPADATPPTDPSPGPHPVASRPAWTESPWVIAAVMVAAVLFLGLMAARPATPAVASYDGYSHQDATYLRALDAAGMSYSTRAAAIDTGRLIGQLYDGGASMSAIKGQFHASAVVARSPYTTWQLDRMVEAGVASYASRAYSTR